MIHSEEYEPSICRGAKCTRRSDPVDIGQSDVSTIGVIIMRACQSTDDGVLSTLRRVTLCYSDMVSLINRI
jgi:hypothetical protein